MRLWDRLALALIIFMSNDATLTLGQYVTTVTVSINDNPFCTPVSGMGVSGGSGSEGGAGSAPDIGVSGVNGGGGDNSGLGTGLGATNSSTSVTSSATSGDIPIAPIITTNGRFDALGYYTAPADGRLLGGPIITSPSMSVELCGTSCPGYAYLALENGNDCNCGTSLPNGPSSSSPPPLGIRRAVGGDCTPCAGNGAECCGAPGYALLYRFTPNVVGSAGLAYSSMSPIGSIAEVSSTVYSLISLPSIIAYTSTGSGGLVTVGSTISSYGAIASTSTYVNSTVSGGGRGPKPQTDLGDSSVGNVISSNGSGTVSSLKPGSSHSFIGSYNVIPGVGNPATAGSASTTATGGASAIASNGGNGGASFTASASNSVVKGTVGSGGAAATTKVGATSAINGVDGPEPTVTATPSCVESSNYAGNNTKYSDFFGYTYDIRCNLDLQSTPTDYDAHADNFENCLEYCSLLTDCIAVSYQDPPDTPKDISNCYPKWNFNGYRTSGVDGLYSGVNVNGASPGTLENQDLCTSNNTQAASYDGITYYDDFGTPWTIGCDATLVISNAAALFPTITDTLASCVDYCSIYQSCEMVNWTGPHTNGTLNDPNCFPASSIGKAGATGSASGSAYAKLYS